MYYRYYIQIIKTVRVTILNTVTILNVNIHTVITTPGTNSLLKTFKIKWNRSSPEK